MTALLLSISTFFSTLAGGLLVTAAGGADRLPEPRAAIGLIAPTALRAALMYLARA